MSTQFRPLEIPPGVVAKPTKQQRSTNWAQVNLMRWIEGQLTPVGGQSQYNFTFASRCKKIHGWFGLDQIYHIAFLCEAHLYVLTGGTLTDVSPVSPIHPPTPVGEGGYGDSFYTDDTYGTPRSIPSVTAQDKVPSAYSLDNFGSILYAMTSSDGRLLMWDPSAGSGIIGGVTAVNPFTTSSAIIYTTTIPSGVTAGMPVFDVTLEQAIGIVASVSDNNPTVTSVGLFTPDYSAILITPAGAGVGVGMTVTDTTTGLPVGAVASHSIISNTIAVQSAFTANYRGAFMPDKPAWVALGMTMTDTTNSAALGNLQFYGRFIVTLSLATSINIGDTTLHMLFVNDGQIIPGMLVFCYDTSAHTSTAMGKVVSYIGSAIVIDTPSPVNAASSLTQIKCDSNSQMAVWSTKVASSGATDVLRFDSGANEILQLTSNATSNSSGSTDTLKFFGGSKLTMTANSLFASSGPNDILQFGSNKAVVQPETAGRGPVPNGRCFVVTNERYIMMFGTANDGTVEGGKQNRFAWCDQENPGAWDYSSVTSMAGFLDIEPASPIICASSTRNGVLFFTGKKAYNSVYLGMPYIYNYNEIGVGCTPWSPQSITGTSALTVWMSKQGAFSFDGTSILPVNCLVRPWVDDDIDLLQVREQACIVHVGDFNEVWWFFPQDGQTKNTRCIIYSYKEGWWSQGLMARTAGITSSYTAHTIMADDLVAYQHEVPNAYPANVPLPWAETYDLNLNSGSRLTTLKQLIPDVQGAIQNLLYSVFYRTSRSVALDAGGNVIAAPELQTIPQLVRTNGYVDFRVTARDFRLRIEIGALPGQPRPGAIPVTVGQHLIDSVPRGDR